MVKFSHQFHGTTPSGWLIKVLKLSAESFNTLIRKWCVCVFMGCLIMWGTILSIIPPNIQWCSMTFYLFIKLLISDSGPTNPQVRTSISISLGGLAAGSKSLCQVPPIQGPWIPSCVSKWAWVHFSKLCLIQRKFSIIQGMIVYVYLTRGPVSKVTQMIVEEGPRSWIRSRSWDLCRRHVENNKRNMWPMPSQLSTMPERTVWLQHSTCLPPTWRTTNVCKTSFWQWLRWPILERALSSSTA